MVPCVANANQSLKKRVGKAGRLALAAGLSSAVLAPFGATGASAQARANTTNFTCKAAKAYVRKNAPVFMYSNRRGSFNIFIDNRGHCGPGENPYPQKVETKDGNCTLKICFAPSLANN